MARSLVMHTILDVGAKGGIALLRKAGAEMQSGILRRAQNGRVRMAAAAKEREHGSNGGGFSGAGLTSRGRGDESAQEAAPVGGRIERHAHGRADRQFQERAARLNRYSCEVTLGLALNPVNEVLHG